MKLVSQGCDKLLTEQDAIDILGLHVRPNPRGALLWLCRKRKLAHVRVAQGILRFRMSDLQEFIDKQRVETID